MSLSKARVKSLIWHHLEMLQGVNDPATLNFSLAVATRLPQEGDYRVLSAWWCMLKAARGLSTSRIPVACAGSGARKDALYSFLTRRKAN